MTQLLLPFPALPPDMNEHERLMDAYFGCTDPILRRKLLRAARQFGGF